jgi:hypothetical protein
MIVSCPRNNPSEINAVNLRKDLFIEALISFGTLPIPKGLRRKAQGCEARATLGNKREKEQPQRGCDRRGTFTKAETPLGFCSFDSLPQGSSCLATLGFVAESLWDSRKRHSSETWFTPLFMSKIVQKIFVS